MPSFGRLLREKRRMAGISQRDLAGRVKLDFSYISKVENDRLPPPAANTIVAICQTLDIDPMELLAASGKLPTEIQSTVASSAAAQSFLLNASKMDLTEGEWDELTSSLHRLREG
jgi:transcriptional regulator with XRE-family HTH domain